MGKDNVITFKNPETTIDLLTEILRKGAQRLLAAAVEEEVEQFLSLHNKPEEKPRFVRNTDWNWLNCG